MDENRGAPELKLDQLLLKLDPVDLVLIEGWKRDLHPKIEAWRAEAGNPLIAPQDPTILAVATDISLQMERPVFDLNDTETIADFILRQTRLIE